MWRGSYLTEPYASAETRVAASGATPSTRTRLAREVSPLTSVTADFGTPQNSARNAHKTALALPSTGGAARRSFIASPWRPANSVRLALGWMCRVRTRSFPSRRSQEASLTAQGQTQEAAGDGGQHQQQDLQDEDQHQR